MNKAMLTREQKNEKYKHTSLEMETSTHFPILLKLVAATEGPIMEVGSGLFSTPLLHWLCFENKRDLITVERHFHYFEFAKKFINDSHRVLYLKEIHDALLLRRYSIVFIDHSPKKPRTRGDDALLFANKADYIVLHDCGPNPKEKYGYQQLFSQFRFCFHYLKTGAHTTVLSNFKDPSWLEN